MTDEEITAAFQTPAMQDLTERYNKAMHAMQTGVAMEMYQPDRKSATEPKHLRVGVNSALVETSALGTALMRKGLLTPEEYYSAMVEQMESEVASYQTRISAAAGGANVKLA